MPDLEIMLIDNYKVPGLAAMVVDIVYKNNTPSYIQIAQPYICGSISRNFNLICVPPFATSGYYLFRSGNIQTCPTTMPLIVRRCGTGVSCPTLTTCVWSDILATGIIPVYRVVTTIPTREEILAKVTGIPIGPTIEAISVTPVSIECQAPCDAVIDITWKNNGNQPGDFTPAIIVSNVRIAPHPTQSLAIGASITKRFTLTGLVAGTYSIESDPSGITIPIIVTGIIPPICVPSWRCEWPLNGYESDGCGNRRLNSACSPVEPPIVPPSNSTGLLLIGIGLLTILLFKSKKEGNK